MKLFNFDSKEKELKEKFAMQSVIDRINRENDYLGRARSIEDENVKLRAELEGQNKRIDHIEARHKAVAEKGASELAARMAGEYADKTVAMAAKCSADFGNAMGKALEQVMSLLKEFKPIEAKITILPVASSEVNIASCESTKQ